MIVGGTRLFRIEAPRFTAGVEIDASGRVSRAARMLKFALPTATHLGWRLEALRRLCHERGWQIEECKWARFKEKADG